MTKTNPSQSDPNRFYFYDDATKIVYHTSEMIEEGYNELIFIGESDNPNPKMAAAAFLRSGKVETGYRLKELVL